VCLRPQRSARQRHGNPRHQHRDVGHGRQYGPRHHHGAGAVRRSRDPTAVGQAATTGCTTPGALSMTPASWRAAGPTRAAPSSSRRRPVGHDRRRHRRHPSRPAPTRLPGRAAPVTGEHVAVGLPGRPPTGFPGLVPVPSTGRFGRCPPTSPLTCVARTSRSSRDRRWWPRGVGVIPLVTTPRWGPVLGAGRARCPRGP
jgi:hypothetical protein